MSKDVSTETASAVRFGDGDSESDSRPMRVLIVDDFLSGAQGMARIMEIHGHHVRLARDGPEGIATAKAFRPDVVLLDIGLPGMDGHEVAERLRADRLVKDCLIVAISGHCDDPDNARWREVGMDHYMVKPVNLESLLNLISRSKRI